ncbi:MAG TPA: CHAD domain-containing protein [Longilinea sp.]|nr:CHAD domain-containing protein [Longilinea sp.]
MKTRTDVSIQEFGAEVLLRNLGALEQEFEGVRQGQDIEAIHRMRVASRRLRAALPIFGPAVAAKKHEEWTRTIRELTVALGAARDCDVQIEHVQAFFLEQPPGIIRSGIRRLLLRLRQRRLRLQLAVDQALTDLVKSDVPMEMERKLHPLLEGMETVPRSPALCSLSFETIREKLEQFLYFEPFVQQPENIKELHAMRIAAKHLRYTLEIFSPVYESELKVHLKAMRQIQEMLGEIHDCDVWMLFLPKFTDRERLRTLQFFGYERPFRRLLPGLEAYFSDRSAARERSYKEFLEKWQTWRQEGLWDQLINEVSALCIALPPQAKPLPTSTNPQ